MYKFCLPAQWQPMSWVHFTCRKIWNIYHSSSKYVLGWDPGKAKAVSIILITLPTECLFVYKNMGASEICTIHLTAWKWFYTFPLYLYTVLVHPITTAQVYFYFVMIINILVKYLSEKTHPISGSRLLYSVGSVVSGKLDRTASL